MATDLAVLAEAELLAAFADFIAKFQAAQEAGVDAQVVLAQHLREALGEDGWAALPPMVRMLF